jgi:hypothetical protein
MKGRRKPHQYWVENIQNAYQSVFRKTTKTNAGINIALTRVYGLIFVDGNASVLKDAYYVTSIM